LTIAISLPLPYDVQRSDRLAVAGSPELPVGSSQSLIPNP
jgi:hypothetical protein